MVRPQILIAWLVVLSAAEPVLCRAGESPAGIGRRVDAYLTALVPFGYWGAALVAIDGKVVLNRGYGWADIEGAVANTPKTLFGLQSVTKQFTAAAVVSLQQDGKLGVQDSIARYLPGVPPDKRGITLHHLLTHTSGVISGTEIRLDDMTRDGVVRAVLDEPLAFEPGTDFMYSNFGYELLAAIVELASGQSYDDYVIARLFRPAGMNATGHRPAGRHVAAHWYAQGEDQGDPRTWPYPDWNSFGSGGMLSTPMDMFRWHEALLGERVLSAASKEILYTTDRNGYAYGWEVEDGEHGRLIRHNGGSSHGSATSFRRYIDAGVTTILFCNRDGETMLFGERVVDHVNGIVFGGEVETPPVVRPFQRNERDALAGSYAIGGDSLFLESSGEALILRAFGQDAVDALLGPGEASHLRRTGERAGVIFDAFARGDTVPLFSVFSSAERGTRFVRYFRRQREEKEVEYGPLRGYRVLGTTPDWVTDFGGEMTFVRGEFERGSRVFRLHWKDGVVAAVGGEGIPEPVRVHVLQGAAQGELAGYHVPTAHAIAIRVGRGNNGAPESLTFANGGISAKKTGR